MGSYFSQQEKTSTDSSEDEAPTPKRKEPGFHDYFETVCELGSGSFGVVKKVREKKTGTFYAVKEISVNTSNDSLIQREIESQKNASDHINVVEFIQVFKEASMVRIVLEFCELGNLDTYFRTRTVTYDLQLLLMCDMANGLHFLHKKEIVHRDIKPENILLREGSSRPICKIADFGLARHRDLASSMQVDCIDSYMMSYKGTRFFMAPEVRKQHYNKSCDIFSLGVVFYAMVMVNYSGVSSLTPKIKSKFFYEDEVTDDEIKKSVKKMKLKPKTLRNTIIQMLKKDYHDRIDSGRVLEYLELTQQKLENSNPRKCVVSWVYLH